MQELIDFLIPLSYQPSSLTPYVAVNLLRTGLFFTSWGFFPQERSRREVQPVDAAQPVDAVWPVDAAQPVDAVRPVDAVQPVDAVRPVDAAQPVDVVQPAHEPPYFHSSE